MLRSSSARFPLQIALDPAKAQPLQQQLYWSLRERILRGHLRAGLRLPSSRGLAGQLGIARNTVTAAFEMLVAEGYLVSRIGAGTFVAPHLPDIFLQPAAATEPATRKRAAAARTSVSRGGRAHLRHWPGADRGGQLAPRHLATLRLQPAPAPLLPAGPALEQFPVEQWGRLLSRCWRRGPLRLLASGHPQGDPDLREAIAAYLGSARGVQCEASQVVITSGSQQGLDLTARVLLNPGEQAWVEDPGYWGAHSSLQGAGVQAISVPVDKDGMDVPEALRRAPAARLALITPSHQFPLGITMSLPRRLQLLQWAQETHGWVLEDDFDSEFRYSGRPLTALQGLDGEGRVLYLGTFSRVLFPALRIGYLVLPPELVKAFVAARAAAGWQSAVLEQQVLARFIGEGHFGRHLRRMRALYAQRREALLQALAQLQEWIEAPAPDCGLHAIGWLKSRAGRGRGKPAESRLQTMQRAAGRCGYTLVSLARFCTGVQLPPALLLPFSAEDERTLRQRIRLLADELAHGRPPA